MNKVILKHISIILTVFVVIILFWLLFIYIFFDKEIKKTIYPIIDDSKQNLSEIVSKDFASDKVNKFISELEKNKYIRYISVIDNNVIDTKKESKFLSLLKLSYPIKNGTVVAGMVEVWPSYELFAKIFSDKINIIIFLISIIFLFALL